MGRTTSATQEAWRVCTERVGGGCWHVAHQGESSSINEDKLHNELKWSRAVKKSASNETILGGIASWFDHVRDLLHTINHFRKEMPRLLLHT